MITEFDNWHQQSYEQLQHDCNCDISRGYLHSSICLCSDILFFNISIGHESNSGPEQVWILYIVYSRSNDTPSKDIPSEWRHSHYTAAH